MHLFLFLFALYFFVHIIHTKLIIQPGVWAGICLLYLHMRFSFVKHQMSKYNKLNSVYIAPYELTENKLVANQRSRVKRKMLSSRLRTWWITESALLRNSNTQKSNKKSYSFRLNWRFLVENLQQLMWSVLQSHWQIIFDRISSSTEKAKVMFGHFLWWEKLKLSIKSMVFGIGLCQIKTKRNNTIIFRGNALNASKQNDYWMRNRSRTQSGLDVRIAALQL